MNKSYVLATSIAVLATAWIASGFIVSSNAKGEDIESKQAKQKEIIEVRVRDMDAELLISDVVITGVSQASKTVSLSAEIDGQIAQVFKEEGDTVEIGDVIAKIEKNDKEARLKEAQRLVEQRQIEYRAAKALENKGFNSRIKLAESLANLESAKAHKKQAEIDLEKTSIISPIDGIISRQDVEVGGYVNTQGGEPLFHIVDLSPIEFVGYVSERNILNINKGAEATITFMNGMQHKGLVNYIAPAADAQTRTFRIIVEADNPENKIIDGLTTRISIPKQEKMAHKISPSILALNDAGDIGVKIVNSENKVEFIKVDILKDTPEYMWVSNLPQKSRIITIGQEFIIEGQIVKPVISQAKGAL